MTPPAPFPSGRIAHWMKSHRPEMVVWILGMLLRLVYLWQIRNAPAVDLLMGDAELFDRWAQEIAGGAWLGETIFFQAPFYPYFLGVVYGILGRDLMAVRLIQICIGSLSCVLVTVAGQRLFSKPVGLMAGLLLAVYPGAIFFDGLIQKAVFGLFFMALLLFLVARQISTPAPVHRNAMAWAAIGLVLGLFVLVRENALILAPILFFWIWAGFRNTPSKRRLTWSLWMAVGLGLVLMPVAVRNKVVGNAFVLTTANFGFNLHVGNGQTASGTYSAIQWARGDWRYEAKDATDLAEKAMGKPLSATEVSRYWTMKTLSHIAGHPWDWLRLMGKKWLLIVNATELSDTESRYAYEDWSWLLRGLGFFDFGVLLALAGLGIHATWRDRRRLWILYLILLGYAVGITLFFVFSRFRHPLSAILILFAAAGLHQTFQKLGKGAPTHRRRVTGLAILAALFIVSRVDLVSREEMAAHTYYNLGVSREHEGRISDAVALYEKSLALNPRHALCQNNLGIVLFSAGKTLESIRHLRQSLAIRSDLPEPHINLGMVLFHAGRLEESLAHFKEATTLSPNKDPRIYYNIACIEARLGKPEAAMASLREAIAHGYADWHGIENDPDLDSVRRLPQFESSIRIPSSATKTPSDP